MVQGSLKKLAKKSVKATVVRRQAKVISKRGRKAASTQPWSKAKKKIQGVYTAGLENNIVGKMNPSEQEKLKMIHHEKKAKPLSKDEKRARARSDRRDKKKGTAAAMLAEAEVAAKTQSLA
eukprot:TRINITY_DN23149_c0_g1_i1.p1 TRINITY_DN23149_c0_g1~~TRINITY_DN23149_c0_g1_i1.p1  ORF type:complete len:121 (+),score=32.47 TRINITY_DN23149_c0_g1_i1:40-402(+)